MHAPCYILICCLSACTTLSVQRHDFWGKFIEHKTCVLIYIRILSEKFIVLRTIQGDKIINIRTASFKVPVILVTF